MNARIKKTIQSVLLPVIAIVLFSACQPTPTTPAVKGKSNDLIKKAGSAEAEEIKNDKKKIKDQIDSLGGHLKTQFNPSPHVVINVDADIATPGLEPIPMVRLKPANFPKELFDRYMNYSTGGRKLYNVNTEKDKLGNLYDQLYTKEEISAILIKIKGRLANKDISKIAEDDLSYELKELEDESKSAISRADEKPYDGTLETVEDDDETEAKLKCYMGKDRAAYFILWGTQNGDGSQITFCNSDYFVSYGHFEPYQGKAAKNIKMTYEEAKAKAEDFVRTADGKDSNLVIYGSDIGYESSPLTDYTKEIAPQAYQFTFARSYNGVVVKPLEFLGGQTETTEYSQHVHPEDLSLVINDEGIVESTWVNYSEYIETVSKDVPLLDFDTIRQMFEKHCSQEFSWTPINNPDALVTFNIKNIELNLIAIPEKNNPGVCITVPVWDFIGYEEGDEAPSDTGAKDREKAERFSIVTINAMDGSVINREAGY